MGTLWRWWKKGFFLEILVTIVALILTFVGIGTLVLTDIISKEPDITIVAIIMGIVAFPIIRGFFMEKLEKWVR